MDSQCFLWPGVLSCSPSSGDGSRVRWVAWGARVPVRPSCGSWQQSHALWCCATSSSVVAQVRVWCACALAWRVSVASAARVFCFLWPCVISVSLRSGHRALTYPVACPGGEGGSTPLGVRVPGPGGRVEPWSCMSVCLCAGPVSLCRIWRARPLFSAALCADFFSELGTQGLTCEVICFLGPALPCAQGCLGGRVTPRCAALLLPVWLPKSLCGVLVPWPGECLTHLPRASAVY